MSAPPSRGVSSVRPYPPQQPTAYLERVEDALRLPAVLDEQQLQQQLQVGPQLVVVAVGDLPEQLRQRHAREGRVLPGAVAQQLTRLLHRAGVLDDLLQIAAGRADGRGVSERGAHAPRSQSAVPTTAPTVSSV